MREPMVSGAWDLARIALRNLRVVLLGLALLAARPAMAGIELAGTTGANFLTIGPGASVIGMGGTGNAGYPDLSSMAWNPAALGLLNESQLMLTHMPLPNSASQEWMSFGGRMGVAPTRWALSGRYEGDGSFVAKDPLGNVTGTFNSSSLALGVNAARPLDLHTVVGMGAKFVNENLGSVSGYGGTFDFGVVYHNGPMTLGATALNMGGSMKYDSLAYSMPLTFGTGLALSSERAGLTIAVDYNHPNAYYDDVRTGAEWLWKDHFALRVGYRKELNAPSDDPMTGVSGGFGIGGHGMWLDYGYVASADGSNQQRVSIRVSPKEWAFLANDIENPNDAGASSAARPAPAASSTQAPAATSSSIAPAPAATTPAPPAAPPVAAPGTSASSGTTSGAAPAATTNPKPATTSTKSATTATSAPAPAAVMPPPVAPAPTSPMPTASSSKPSTPEPSAPAPALTTLVPVTPPAIPAPKPVVTSKPNTMPGVSAPAPQVQPTEAPVTTPPAESGTAAPVSGKGQKGKPAATTPAVAAPAVAAPAPATVETAVGKDGKAVRIHVKKDETLDSIAKRFGTTKAAIMMENNLVTDKIRPGQELKIPNHQ